MNLGIAAHLSVDTQRQGVDHRRTHTMETAGHGVTATSKLAACMKLGKDKLDTCQFRLSIDVDRDTTSVVDDLSRTVGVQRDLDSVTEPGQRLIDRVVDNLPKTVLQSATVG
jgi:hypothetical protein